MRSPVGQEREGKRKGGPLHERTRSGGSENYVEVTGGMGSAVGVRDSKNPADPTLVFTFRQWDAFTDAVKNGKFDG
jgi:hypothetical protein